MRAGVVIARRKLDAAGRGVARYQRIQAGSWIEIRRAYADKRNFHDKNGDSNRHAAACSRAHL